MITAPTPTDPDAQRREALATLDRLREQPTYAGSALAAAGQRATEHFAGRDPGEPQGQVDRIEQWGRRIGRALSLAGVIALAGYLYVTYLR